MPGGDFFIMMLLLWTFVGRGVDGETVTGVLHERVELRGRYGQNPDVESVEWASYTVNSTKKVLYSVIKAGNVTCFYRCQNISFNLENMSLILDHITKKDEGNYEEKTIFKNKTILYFNITLSVPCLDPRNQSESKNNVSSSCDSHENISTNDTFLQKNVSVTQNILFTAGLSLICLLVLCISLICLCIHYDRRKIKNASNEEPLYQEPTSFQLEAVTPAVEPLLVVYQDFRKPEEPTSFQPEAPALEPLLVVYQDFIKPEDSHQSEDFGYSTIPDVKEKIQPSKSSSSKLPKT